MLLEVKSTGPRTDVDRALVRRGARPTSFSKYIAALELAALRHQRPRKHQARVLDRFFVPHGDQVGSGTGG